MLKFFVTSPDACITIFFFFLIAILGGGGEVVGHMCLTGEVVQTQAAEYVVEFLLFYGRLSQLSLKFLQK